MRVRHLIREPKLLASDTGWKTSDLPPRHAPIYDRKRPFRAGWEWRSARAKSDTAEYVLLAQCNTERENWQAWLLALIGNTASVVGRFEHHGNHPGLHLHAHCQRSGIEPGVAGIGVLDRVPGSANPHRRQPVWTKATVWEAAKRFFRITDPAGPLP